MVDRDTKEISAINEVFPNSSVLLCWFHVLQVLYHSIYVSYILPYSLWGKNQLLNESYSVKFHSIESIGINCIGFNILYLVFVYKPEVSFDLINQLFRINTFIDQILSC